MRRALPRRVYRAYGLRLGSPWPLPCPEESRPGPVDVELCELSAGAFARAARPAAGRADGDDWVH